ncbi:enoyl-CoA hydratase-related protein [Paraburkholderia xenovorans]|uniref:enoyl-CoA hydratase/isomerase family protein n=1 Tax=Paraburkholderia xenovorans TaxID=36873 RepID=UPI0038BCD8A2
MSESSEVLWQEDDSKIGVITLNRPAALNALNVEMLQRLSALLDMAARAPEIDALILTGAGDVAFSAGADIRHLHASSPLDVREFARLAVSVTRKIETLGKPVVAALNGATLGGGLEIAESCMIRIAARGVQLGHPEVKIGAVAGFGGTTRLPRLVGRGRAAEMLLTGRTVDSEEALRIGLVQFVFERNELLAATKQIVADILAQSPTAVRLTWEALHRGLNLSLEEAAELGADYFGLVAATEDFRRGTCAFIDKEKPEFIGR